jgi:hypothetical protein
MAVTMIGGLVIRFAHFGLPRTYARLAAKREHKPS